MEDQGFPGGSAGKEFTCHAGDPGSVPGLGRSPGGGHGNLLQYSCLESPHEQRSLMGCKESDTTEQLSTAQHSMEDQITSSLQYRASSESNRRISKDGL